MTCSIKTSFHARSALLLSVWIIILFGLVTGGISDALIKAVEGKEGIPVPEASVSRINELRREIARHDDLYFRLAAPEISDFEYDQLKAELLRLELLYPDSEYERPSFESVGDDRTGRFETHRHRVPMLSLDKAMSREDLMAFHRRVTGRLGREDLVYWVEPKFDGIAISLTYERGELVRAVTRGNGVEGDNITDNVRTIRGIPMSLHSAAGEAPGNTVPDLIEIRGELFISFTEFERINTERVEAGDPAFSNARNLAAGTSKLFDPNEVAQRNLEAVFFGWGGFEPADDSPADLAEFRKRLAGWGFPTVTHATRAVGPMEMWAAVEAVEQARESFNYPIDGAVIKLVSVADQDLLGWSRTAPRWAVAMKFAPERITTRLLAITLQVGRTGIVTPVAELDPVWLDGSTVARATLHNADEIARRDLRIGDLVWLEKGGDIIPAIVGVDLDQRPMESQPFLFPSSCPVCGEWFERLEGRAAIRCVNDGCPAMIARRLEHFVSPAAMNIRGLGPATIATLVAHDKARTPADLYHLTREDLLPISGIGERSAENILSAIGASRERDWERVIHGLGIPGVGLQRAGVLARAFPDFQTLAQARIEQLMASGSEGGAGLGEALATSIVDYLTEPVTQGLLRALSAAGVLGGVAADSQPGAFAGEVVVVTGTLDRWTRAEVTALLLTAGARASNNVTRETTLLVAGERPGSKLDRARALGVPVIREEELARRLE